MGGLGAVGAHLHLINSSVELRDQNPAPPRTVTVRDCPESEARPKEKVAYLPTEEVTVLAGPGPPSVCKCDSWRLHTTSSLP